MLVIALVLYGSSVFAEAVSNQSSISDGCGSCLRLLWQSALGLLTVIRPKDVCFGCALVPKSIFIHIQCNIIINANMAIVIVP